MALPSEQNKKPIVLQENRPIDQADPFSNQRVTVQSTAEIPLIFTNNWLMNYVHALEMRMGNLPSVEILEKYGPQITSLTELSVNSADAIIQLKAKDTLHDTGIKSLNDQLNAAKAQHVTDVKAINDKAQADVKAVNDKIAAEVKALKDQDAKDKADLIAADAADKKALTDRVAAVEKASNDSDAKHNAALAQHTTQIKQLQDSGASTTATLGTLSDAVLQANTAATKANTDLIAIKTDAGNVKLKLTELAAEVKAASQAAQSSIPVGTIIDWLGGFYNLSVPAGFWPCDGTDIKDPTSPLNGKKAPDLREVYTAGATDGKGSGTILGSNTYALKASDLPAVKAPDTRFDYTPSGSVSIATGGDHNHPTRVSYGNSGNQIAISATGNGFLNQDIYSNNSGNHSHTATFSGTKTTITVPGAMLNTSTQTQIDMRPKTLYVTKLIKI
ncbi:hypothetical protein [Aeromonas veronii]|uniref:hypothetical protein n=1 Tax=Aeromonas veronii TaxID=654 RepID=UPI0036726446